MGDADQPADFSSRGPRVGDAALKPEVTAPGVGIVAARARNGTIGEPAGDGYVSLNGTSMATPHVAGAAALLAQQHPDWTGAQLRSLLVGTAAPTDGVGAFTQGAGRIDVGRAVGQDVHAEPHVVSAGRQPWPHDDDEALTRTVTYRNPGTEPVTLGLDAHVLGPDGAPAPAGVVTLGADAVTVPAGGEAGVDVTVDTSGPGPDGQYSARIVAVAGDTVVTTPVAVDKEPESYELTVVNRDRDGAPAGDYSSSVVGLEQGLWRMPYDPDGTYTLRLPRGRYLVETTVSTPRGGGQPESSLLVQPRVELDRDRTVELDARQARPLAVDFDREGVQLQVAGAGFEARHERSAYNGGIIVFGTLDGVTTASFGPTVGRRELIAQFQGAWAAPAAVRPRDAAPPATEAYNLAWFEYGRMMTGQSRHVRDAQLARVEVEERAMGEGRLGLRLPFARPPGMGPLLGAVGAPTPLPTRRVELYNTRGVEWSTEFAQVVVDPDAGEVDEVWLDSDVHDYRAGRTHRERWNAAVLGPIVSEASASVCTEQPDRTSDRTGDTVTIAVDMLSDADGHTGCGLGEGRTSLSRDGEPIGEAPHVGWGVFEVPAGRATYRVETDLTRYPTAVLSTRVTTAWTFASEHVAGDEPQPLSLMAVRFAPELDAHNGAPAGVPAQLPFTVDHQGDVGRIATPTVEASFDDGRTWAPLDVDRRHRGRYVASLTHPAGDGFVSLRATAADNRGNAVEQTIIRAYQLTS